MADVERIVDEATTSIEEIRDSVFVIRARDQLLVNAGAIIQQQNQGEHTRKVIEEFFRTKTISSDALFRGLFVQLGSILEQFVRRVMEEVLEHKTKNASEYSQLSDTVKKRNMFVSGKALQTVYGGVSGRKLNYEEISRKLGTCIEGNVEFELNKECFSLQLRNCTHKHLEDLMETVGVGENFWDGVARVSTLRKQLGSGGVRETKKLATTQLDEYVRLRNGIVHRGEIYKTITESELISNAAFFEAMCKSIGEHISRAV